jgi:hypothetical protein
MPGVCSIQVPFGQTVSSQQSSQIRSTSSLVSVSSVPTQRSLLYCDRSCAKDSDCGADLVGCSGTSNVKPDMCVNGCSTCDTKTRKCVSNQISFSSGQAVSQQSSQPSFLFPFGQAVSSQQSSQPSFLFPFEQAVSQQSSSNGTVGNRGTLGSGDYNFGICGGAGCNK